METKLNSYTFLPMTTTNSWKLQNGFSNLPTLQMRKPGPRWVKGCCLAVLLAQSHNWLSSYSAGSLISTHPREPSQRSLSKIIVINSKMRNSCSKEWQFSGIATEYWSCYKPDFTRDLDVYKMDMNAPQFREENQRPNVMSKEANWSPKQIEVAIQL